MCALCNFFFTRLPSLVSKNEKEQKNKKLDVGIQKETIQLINERKKKINRDNLAGCTILQKEHS